MAVITARREVTMKCGIMGCLCACFIIDVTWSLTCPWSFWPLLVEEAVGAVGAVEEVEEVADCLYTTVS